MGYLKLGLQFPDTFTGVSLLGLCIVLYYTANSIINKNSKIILFHKFNKNL